MKSAFLPIREVELRLKLPLCGLLKRLGPLQQGPHYPQGRGVFSQALPHFWQESLEMPKPQHIELSVHRR